MAKEQRRFADDGWAVWLDGDDTSTLHINDWLNTTGKSYVDIAVHVRGIKLTKSLNVYVPFLVSKEEIEDVSLFFENTRIIQAIFKPRIGVGSALRRLRTLLTTPVISEKYGYSIRINESRLLPEEITRIGTFHREKLNKAAITISVDESYELNDSGCYRIRRLENNLYKTYLPADYPTENVITYQWYKNREYNSHGQFNFYYSITRNSISKGSMILYLILLLTVGVVSNTIFTAIQTLIGLVI